MLRQAKIKILEKALAKCESLDIEKLITSATKGIEAIYEYLNSTVYSDAVLAIKDLLRLLNVGVIIELLNYKATKIQSLYLISLVAYLLARKMRLRQFVFAIGKEK